MPLTKKTPVGDVVKDFYKSDAPQFKGKSKKKKREMAVAAALSKKDKKKMTKEELKELVKTTIDEITVVDRKTTPDEAAGIAKKEKKDLPTVKQAIATAKSTNQPISVAETSTPKYDDDPTLSKGQKNLPDALQKGIIDAAKKKGVKSEAITYMPDKDGEFKRTDTGRKDPTQASLDNLLQRLKDEEDLTEDIDIGHQDDEVGMLVADLYRINKYSGELCDMVKELGQLDGEIDFPHWWQAKVIKARDYMVGAKHYLDGELKTGQAFGND